MTLFARQVLDWVMEKRVIKMTLENWIHLTRMRLSGVGSERSGKIIARDREREI
jgi:hypothetical protein